jgi:type IV pilus assembly protein PilA
LIIGILAAIALPTFLGQQSKGQDASAKANARNMVSLPATSGESFTVSESGGVMSRSCTPMAVGGCPSNGSW